MPKTLLKPQSVLLIGPTGSGKSPIGGFLEQMTNWIHVDFGHALRNIESGKNTRDIKTNEIVYIKSLLSKNLLFPPEKTILALKIIHNYVANKKYDGLILNGFPRSIHQADATLKIYNIKTVVNLKCSNETVIQRVLKRKCGDGFDHSNRNDDHLEAILNKIHIFNKETVPLLRFFEEKGIKILNFDIKTDENEQLLAKKIVNSMNLLKK